MNNDLISREALLRSVRSYAESKARNEGLETANNILRTVQVIEAAPAVDAEPVRHGQWLRSVKGWAWPQDITCSMCGDEYNFYKPPRYCPGCGAKMDGDDEE